LDRFEFCLQVFWVRHKIAADLEKASGMRLKNKLLLWLLRNQRPAYLKLKGLENWLAIAGDNEFWELQAQLLQDERGGGLTLIDRYNLYSLAKTTSRLPGALAEAGVYRGGGARILCAVKGGSPLYLFDTFQGMPGVNAATDGGFSKGDFADTRYEEVVAYLSAFPNVHFYKGFFPDSAIGKEPEKQSYRFVHLDLDIYESTYKSLDFFHPRMVSGGLMVSHDYSNLTAPGVKKAFDDFFKDKQETVIPLWNQQCLVVKI
jgi:O-methyltransferase